MQHRQKFQAVQDFRTSLESKLQLQAFTLPLLHIAQWESLQESLKLTINQPKRDKVRKLNKGARVQILLFPDFQSSIDCVAYL